MTYLLVALGSALGGVLRYGLARALEPISGGFPYGTFLVNVLGCFVIGFFGTLTLHGSRYEASQSLRLFVMVGFCGGFTTFSSFSLQTFERISRGAWGIALANVVFSVAVCLAAVSAGHLLAARQTHQVAVTQTTDELDAG